MAAAATTKDEREREREPEEGAEERRVTVRGLRVLRGAEGEQRHGREAPGVACIIALKLPPCKNTPSKRVPTRRGSFVSSHLVSDLSRFARERISRDISRPSSPFENRIPTREIVIF